MASVSESAYEKAVAKFKELVSLCESYGDKYRPNLKAITITELQNLHANAMDAVQRVIDAQKDLKAATNLRNDAFKDLRLDATRVVNALMASLALRQTVDDARSIKAKLDGRRMGATPAAASTSSTGAPETPARRSVSQQSFDMLIAHFNSLYTLVAKEKHYAPNEEELKVESLSAYVARLREANDAAVRASIAFSTARIARDRLMEDEETGIKFIAQAVKAYTRSLFGSTSEEVKKMAKIKIG